MPSACKSMAGASPSSPRPHPMHDKHYRGQCPSGPRRGVHSQQLFQRVDGDRAKKPIIATFDALTQREAAEGLSDGFQCP